MKHSRKALFAKLGVIPTNERWSWCAMDERESKAVFTIWKDRIEGQKKGTKKAPAQCFKILLAATPL